MTNKPKLYVLVGLPGSGKSTWIKNNLHLFDKDVAIISSDDYIDLKAAQEGKTYSQAYSEHIGAATMHAKKAFSDAVKAGKSIIVDQTNMGEKKRRSWLSQVGNKYEKIAVVFDVPEKELFRRLAERGQRTGKHIPMAVIDDMASKYQTPTEAEGFDKILFYKNNVKISRVLYET
jgi:predicted kinase